MQSFVFCCIAGSEGDRKGAQVIFSKTRLLSNNDNIRHLPETTENIHPVWLCSVKSAIKEAENLNWQVQANICIYLI